MSNWQKITPTSPTGEEGKAGVMIGAWTTAESFTVLPVYKRGWHEDYTHWQPITPPPRPDPAKEAFEKWHKRNEDTSYPSIKDMIGAAWHAALAWAKEGNK